ncbi:MAG: HAMP domain-containing sensor histidine kinase [Hyphomicrobiaceae bacterium]
MTDQPDKDAQTLRLIAKRISQGIAQTPAPAPADAAPRLTPAAQHLAKLAHELRTPLSAIVAAAEIMRDERFGPIGDPRYRDYASGIFDGAHHALGVINAMLGTSCPSGRNADAIAFAQLDLNTLAAQVAASVHALLEAAGLAVELRLEPRLPNIIADPVTVRQMLLNLVTNAMRATPAGGSIVVATSYDLAGPVHLTVSDTGTGMSEPEIARALDPGRPSDFEPRPSGGLGLGYPLIWRLADLNGATLAITSEPGDGTCVSITFAAGRVIPI